MTVVDKKALSTPSLLNSGKAHINHYLAIITTYKINYYRVYIIKKRKWYEYESKVESSFPEAQTEQVEGAMVIFLF